jgi:hypothetical protein
VDAYPLGDLTYRASPPIDGRANAPHLWVAEIVRGSAPRRIVAGADSQMVYPRRREGPRGERAQHRLPDRKRKDAAVLGEEPSRDGPHEESRGHEHGIREVHRGENGSAERRRDALAVHQRECAVLHQRIQADLLKQAEREIFPEAQRPKQAARNWAGICRRASSLGAPFYFNASLETVFIKIFDTSAVLTTIASF